MSARMQLPLCQQRHSNVAVVRLQKKGIKLEIACYKNKVVSYRSGLETRLDEVLQIERVFSNVARGSYASVEDIHSALGLEYDELKALKYILDNGQLQVAQAERTSEVDEMIKDIATIISQKCAHSVTKRPFPTSVIEQALRTIGAVVKLDQPVKKQALHLIQRLIEANILPIQRAAMKLRGTFGDEAAVAAMRRWCAENHAEIEAPSLPPAQGGEQQDSATPTAQASPAQGEPNHTLVFLIQPQLFRDVDVFVKSLGPNCAVNVIESAVVETGEGAAADFEVAMLQSSASLPQVCQQAPPAPKPMLVGPSSSTDSGAVSKGHKKHQKKKGKQETSDDSSDDENALHRKLQTLEVGGSKGSGGKFVESDSDDDKRKKKGKSAVKKAPQPQPKANVVVPLKKQPDQPGSDDELEMVSERRKKKKGNAAPQQSSYHNDDGDDDNFDYGDE